MESNQTQAENAMIATPQKEHQWLQQMVGEWTFESEVSMEPGQPPLKTHGCESVQSLGGLWVVGEGKGDMPGGGAATTLVTLGYDPQQQKYVGTFVASMMTHLWVYNGTLDTDAKVLTLNTEGPNCTGDGAIVKYRDVVEFLSDDHRTLTSYMQDDQGEWHPFMKATYRRSR